MIDLFMRSSSLWDLRVPSNPHIERGAVLYRPDISTGWHQATRPLLSSTRART